MLPKRRTRSVESPHQVNAFRRACGWLRFGAIGAGATTRHATKRDPPGPETSTGPRTAAGSRAGLFLFDPNTVGVSASERVADLPDGRKRTIRRPLGVHGVFRNGVEVFDSADYRANVRGLGQVPDHFAPSSALRWENGSVAEADPAAALGRNVPNRLLPRMFISSEPALAPTALRRMFSGPPMMTLPMLSTGRERAPWKAFTPRQIDSLTSQHVLGRLRVVESGERAPSVHLRFTLGSSKNEDNPHTHRGCNR